MNFRPLLYKFDGKKIVINEDYVELVEPEVSKGLTPLENLKQENLDLKIALAEIAETQEQDKLATQLAMAELAELVIGGV